MDTRGKILSTEAAIEAGLGVKQQGVKLTVVIGYFDVLLAAQARELESARRAGGCLMVVLLPHAQSLVSQRARAEVVAGLSMVDYVVTETNDDPESFLRRLSADHVIARQIADEEQTRLLMEHVHVRHSL